MKLISSQLYHYLQSVQAYIAPPIAAVFLLGVFWKRINGKGAITTLVGGFVLGMLRLVLELNKSHLSGVSPRLRLDQLSLFLHNPLRPSASRP